MRRIALILPTLIISSALAGCQGEEEFVWPEPETWECEIDDDYDLECHTYLDILDSPILTLKHPTKNEIWILEQSGGIKSWDGNVTTQIANLSSIVSDCHVEQGLLGMAFSDDFHESRTILLSYVDEGTCEGPNESNLVLASARINLEGKLNMSSLLTLKSVDQPFRNHNGGHILGIGDNQFLWGIGDGGSGYDPDGNGQNRDTLLGSILLFSFKEEVVLPVLQNSSGDPFVLHNGLRNPWRFDLDEKDRLWIADVGQNCWEEVNLVSLEGPENLGWAEMEGFHPVDNSGCMEPKIEHGEGGNFTSPILAYPHSNGNCSITGGFWMNWGPSELRDGYLYGDFCSGSIWILREVGGVWTDDLVGSSGGMIVGFGEGLKGELLIFHWTGEIITIG